jgi:dTDP-4-amino-4,6-dideoxygalactose transaminase
VDVILLVKIPFNQLWTAQGAYRSVVAGALERVMCSGRYILGTEVESFETEFCRYLGVFGGVGVASGTDAVALSLLLGGVGAGDEVLLPAFGPGATITAVLAAGATPVPVDVEWDCRLNHAELERSVTSRTKALVAVHLFGFPEKMADLTEFANRHGLWLVEDCAQAHGASIWDQAARVWRKTGTFGDASAFSFYPTKNLGAMGDAGFCTARSAASLHRLRALRQYGWKRRDKAVFEGRNSRMDEIQAAVLRAGLPELEKWNATRRDLAALYARQLGQWSDFCGTVPSSLDVDIRSVCHLQVILTAGRNGLRRYLASRGVGTGVHYPLAHTGQPAFRGFRREGGYPVAERLAREALSLPIHPFMEAEAVGEVVDTLSAFWSSR